VICRAISATRTAICSREMSTFNSSTDEHLTLAAGH
jgi:hypothetical protein